MAGRVAPRPSHPGTGLPDLDRWAPPPPPAAVVARLEAGSAAGDVVLDPFGRGGWVARAAADLRRKAVTLEGGPLERLLAELVLRPPDLRHLDAAVQALGASARGTTSLRASITDRWAGPCPGCGRRIVVDEVAWTTDRGRPRALRRHWRCAVCRDQLGGGEARQGPPADDEAERADDPGAPAARARLRARFPVPPGAEALVDDVLDLHTPRQLAGLEAILARIEGDLRAAPLAAALRLALLHAVLPASRLATSADRVAPLRIATGRVRLPAGTQWRERNPWLAFEDGVRLVRGFVQRIEGLAADGAVLRFGDDLRSLTEGTSTVVVKVAGPTALGALELESVRLTGSSARPRIRLAVGAPPVPQDPDRVAWAWHATGWALGREAATRVDLEPVLLATPRPPAEAVAAEVAATLGGLGRVVEPDARLVLLLDRPDADAVLAACAVGAASAGWRLAAARLAGEEEPEGGHLELVPPGSGGVPGGPRTRANVALPPLPGGAGDPDVVRDERLFAPAERRPDAPFSAEAAARAVVDATVDVLRLRGEPVGRDVLLGEILVRLDGTGHLRRLVRPPAADGEGRVLGTPGVSRPAPVPGTPPAPAGDPSPGAAAVPGTGDTADGPVPPGAEAGTGPAPHPATALLALVDAALAAAEGGRLVRAGERWWLGERADREEASVPLADRVEWAAFSTLAAGGPLTEAEAVARVAGLFAGPDVPEPSLVRACLESYRGAASTPERLATDDDLARRTADHGELIAALVELGHRLGFACWIGARQQRRAVGGRPLGALLDEREASGPPHLGRLRPEDLEEVDVAWYVRGRVAYLWEVEWTAMLGETVLGRHARTPADDRVARFLVVLPERAGLLRHKLERSPVLGEALEAGGWHVLKADHLRRWAARPEPRLADLEELLGLDPPVEREGDQLALFGAEPA